jgi:heptosyltransferase-2
MKILILRLSSLGDIILTQPITAELRERYPDAEIHYLCKPVFADLLSMFGTGLFPLAYQKSLSWHFMQSKARYDLVIDLHAKFSTWLLRLFVRSRRVVVYDKKRLLRERIVKKKTTESLESTLRLYYSALDRLFPGQGYQVKPLRHPSLKPLPNVVHAGSLPVPEPGRKTIGIFPEAAHPTKIYPEEQWIRLIGARLDTCRFWILGSPAEKTLASRIAGKFSAGVIDLCGRFDLIQLAHVIQACDLVVSGDSGPMHLAAALGARQIAIFGATHPRLGFAPLNGKAVVLAAGLPCQPCSLHGSKTCPLGHFNCMKRITAEQIANYL